MTDQFQTLDAVLQQHRALIERMRSTMQTVFGQMADGRKFTRRPNISLRLIADGDPPAKLVILPNWQSHKRELGCEHQVFELLSERVIAGTELPKLTVKIDPAKGTVKQFRREITIAVNPAYVRTCSFHPPGDAQVLRVISTVQSFFRDHRAVLARGRDNCAVCGRKLTDELSRSRGIGPECLKIIPWLLVLVQNHGTIIDAIAG